MKELTSQQDWDACLAQSEDAPVFVFKHSTTCPISAGAYKRVQDFTKEHDDIPEFVLVKVIESRPVSNAIAESLGVRHQSPQLILVKDGKSVWSASHHGIHGDAIEKALTDLAA